MYSIKKASEMLGIPTVTIRAWENRYGVVSPYRSSGGHRLYSESDLDILRWLKLQIEEKGLKIGEAVVQLRQLQSRQPDTAHTLSPAEPESSVSGSFQSLIQRLYGELIAMNMASAHATIDYAFSFYHYEQVFHEIFVPILIRVGMEWENGAITVAQEHFSSELLMQRITQFFRILPVDPLLPKAMALCPEGEQHHIGLMLFSLFLRKKGLNVLYLGANTPLGSLLPLIRTKSITLVAVSLTNPELQQRTVEWLFSLRQALPGLKFALGGKGFQSVHESLDSDDVLSAHPGEWERWYQHKIATAGYRS